VTTPSKSTIENIIKKNKLGEVNVNKNFLRENSQETTFHYPVVLVQVFVNMGHKITFFAISKFTKHVCVMV
jgi:hypothetical protein